MPLSSSDGSRLSRREVTEVYERYGALMLRRCRTVLRDEALADDAFQESFVNLIRYGAQLRNADHPLRWLYRLCDRCCFRQLDRRKTRGARETTVADIDAHGPAADARLEDRDTVLRLLGQLEERERRVAVLAFVDGLSQGEIGKELGWSRQTINKKLQSIRSQARSMVREGS